MADYETARGALIKLDQEVRWSSNLLNDRRVSGRSDGGFSTDQDGLLKYCARIGWISLFNLCVLCVIVVRSADETKQTPSLKRDSTEKSFG